MIFGKIIFQHWPPYIRDNNCKFNSICYYVEINIYIFEFTYIILIYVIFCTARHRYIKEVLTILQVIYRDVGHLLSISMYSNMFEINILSIVWWWWRSPLQAHYKVRQGWYILVATENQTADSRLNCVVELRQLSYTWYTSTGGLILYQNS